MIDGFVFDKNLNETVEKERFTDFLVEECREELQNALKENSAFRKYHALRRFCLALSLSFSEDGDPYFDGLLKDYYERHKEEIEGTTKNRKRDFLREKFPDFLCELEK